jgi:hypothetical protein
MSVTAGRRFDCERVFGEDRKLRMTFLLAWNESTEHVIQSGSDVEQDVTGNDGNVLVEGQTQGKGVLKLTIGLESFSHRAVVSVDKGQLDEGMQLTEVLLCPAQFEPPGIGHRGSIYATTPGWRGT